jgi:hypothetical protein
MDRVLASKFSASETFANVNVEAAAAVRFKAPDELSVTTPVPCPRLVAPVDESVLNAPVLAVVAPIAVLLIPVAVVLKLLDVKVRAFAPVESDEAESPESDRVPEVAVKFNAPLVKVRPLLAVNNPALVIVPVPIVEIFPVVEMVMLEAKSEPVIEAKVGSPAVFP